jgi:pimeloyl-ACP methyl ester carboxylesterase
MRPRSAWTLASLVAAGAAYAQRFRSPARTNWTPPDGRNVATSTLAARIDGEAGSPVVLLHGLVASGLYWGGAYGALARHHRLVVPDLLGFGRSPRPPSGYGPDDHVGALLTCLDELDVSEPVTVGAHSLGSLIAIRLAAIHPERVNSIVAFGPPLYSDRRSAAAHVGGTSPMGRLFVLPGRSAELACRWVCDHRSLAARLAVLTHPGLPPPVAADSVQHTWESYSETLTRVILANEGPEWLADVTHPVRLIMGDHDHVVEHRFLRRLAAEHDNVSAAMWHGGHDLPLADPGDCVRAIKRMTSASTAHSRGTGGC